MPEDDISPETVRRVLFLVAPLLHLIERGRLAADEALAMIDDPDHDRERLKALYADAVTGLKAREALTELEAAARGADGS
ncbi:MAG: hypothetical protein RR101_13285 [Burkholderiaceae bacterium]